MRTLGKTSMMHSESKRRGAVVSARSLACVRQGQPSNQIFAGYLPTAWEVAGP